MTSKSGVRQHTAETFRLFVNASKTAETGTTQHRLVWTPNANVGTTIQSVLQWFTSAVNTTAFHKWVCATHSMMYHPLFGEIAPRLRSEWSSEAECGIVIGKDTCRVVCKLPSTLSPVALSQPASSPLPVAAYDSAIEYNHQWVPLVQKVVHESTPLNANVCSIVASFVATVPLHIDIRSFLIRSYPAVWRPPPITAGETLADVISWILQLSSDVQSQLTEFLHNACTRHQNMLGTCVSPSTPGSLKHQHMQFGMAVCEHPNCAIEPTTEPIPIVPPRPFQIFCNILSLGRMTLNLNWERIERTDALSQCERLVRTAAQPQRSFPPTLPMDASSRLTATDRKRKRTDDETQSRGKDDMTD